MSILNSSEISEVKAFRSNLKTSIGTPIENSGLVLILCVEGCAVLSINFKEYSFRKGDIAIIPIGMKLIPLKTSSLFQAEIRCVTEQHCEEMEYRISDIPFWNFMMEHPILHPTSIQYNMLSGWFAQMQWAMSDRSFSFYNETISSGIFTLFMMIYKEVKAYVQEPDQGANWQPYYATVYCFYKPRYPLPQKRARGCLLCQYALHHARLPE